MTDDQLNQYLSQPLDKITPDSITDPEQLRQQLEQVRQTGYGWTQDEYEQGLVALASPIQARNGQVIAAIGIGAPAFRFPSGSRRAEIIQQLIDAGNKIVVSTKVD